MAETHGTMTLGDKAYAIRHSIESGCTREEIHAQVEILIGTLVSLGLADTPIEYGDLIVSLDDLKEVPPA